MQRGNELQRRFDLTGPDPRSPRTLLLHPVTGCDSPIFNLLHAESRDVRILKIRKPLMVSCLISKHGLAQISPTEMNSGI